MTLYHLCRHAARNAFHKIYKSVLMKRGMEVKLFGYRWTFVSKSGLDYPQGYIHREQTNTFLAPSCSIREDSKIIYTNRKYSRFLDEIKGITTLLSQHAGNPLRAHNPFQPQAIPLRKHRPHVSLAWVDPALRN